MFKMEIKLSDDLHHPSGKELCGKLSCRLTEWSTSSAAPLGDWPGILLETPLCPAGV